VSDHSEVSHYANYGMLAARYDATREATAVETVLGCLCVAGQRLETMRVLDAGCGTGNYCNVIAHHVAQVTGLDRSPEMLSVAASKVAAHRSEAVRLVAGELRALPFAAATFDGVIINQVLHHLDRPGDRERPGLRQALAEFARVLHPGGVLVIGTCSHLQLGRAFWHLDLLPRAAREVRRRYARLGELVRWLADVGFTHVGNAVPTNAILQSDAYLDAPGPLRATGGSGGADAGTLASPPGPGPMQPPTGTGTTTFAVTKLYIGDTDPDGTPDVANGWTHFGYNIDGVAPNNLAGFCKPLFNASPSQVHKEGINGIENSFGHNILPVLLGINSQVSATINQAITNGYFTLLFSLDQLGTGVSDNPLTSHYAAAGQLGKVLERSCERRRCAPRADRRSVRSA
jgi:ubiquinone/menaquinone biosynthesis C-methylase UbiE